MRHTSMNRREQESLLSELGILPGYLAAHFGALSPEEARVPGPGGEFSPVEQCWHLADLEREGYAQRIRRLLAEDHPALPDFDGARIACERAYRSLPLAEGLQLFRAARLANLRALRAVETGHWLRGGTQEGVGELSLCDVPAMMAEHDAGHRLEIETWLAARAGRGERS